MQSTCHALSDWLMALQTPSACMSASMHDEMWYASHTTAGGNDRVHTLHRLVSKLLRAACAAAEK